MYRNEGRVQNRLTRQLLYDKKRESDLKAAHAEVEARPYMDVLRRRIPLFRITSESWRAFTTEDDNWCSTPGGGGAALRAACSYCTSHAQWWVPCAILREAMMTRVNRVGFALYADFRPEVSGWGKRGRLRCETLLGLREKGPKG